MRTSARCSSQATVSAANVCTIVIVAPAWCQACPSPEAAATCPGCVACCGIAVEASPAVADRARCSRPCMASVAMTVATGA